MMKVVIFGIVICITSNFIEKMNSAIPSSHVDALEGFLSQHTNLSMYRSSLSDFILGKTPEKPGSFKTDLDIMRLDHATLKSIIENMKQTRRQTVIVKEDTAKLFRKRDVKLAHKLFILMRQCIYNIRRRLQETNAIRKKYKHDYSFHIAMMVATVHHLNLRSDNFYAISKTFIQDNTHFMWYLIIYEKILAANTDINDLVKRAFIFHDDYCKSMQDPQDTTKHDGSRWPEHPALPG